MNLNKLMDEIANGVTHYERRNGLKPREVRVVLGSDDMKVVLRKSSDGKEGLIILFKGGSFNNDAWYYWFPSENQLALIAEIPLFAEQVIKKNREVGKTWKTQAKNSPPGRNT